LSLPLIDAHQLSLHPLPDQRRDGDLIFEERIQLRRRRGREPIALQFEEALLISAGQGLAPGNLDVEDDLVALNVIRAGVGKAAVALIRDACRSQASAPVGDAPPVRTLRQTAYFFSSSRLVVDPGASQRPVWSQVSWEGAK
jgi:hypothetical protein